MVQERKRKTIRSMAVRVILSFTFLPRYKGYSEATLLGWDIEFEEKLSSECRE